MNKRARVLAATLSATMVCASPLTALATGADTALPADTAVAGIAFSISQFTEKTDKDLGTVMKESAVSGAEQSEEGAADTTEAAEETEAPAPSPYENIAIAQVKSCVNVRKEPTTESEIVGKIYDNSAATILETVDGEGGQWYHIKSGNCTGYMKAEFFKTGEEAEKIAKEVGNVLCKTTAKTLRLREDATTTSRTLDLLAENSVYSVLEESVDSKDADGTKFIKVLVSEGEDGEDDLKGYVSADYASVYVEFTHAKTVEEIEAEKAEEERLKRLEEEAKKAAEEAARKKAEEAKKASSSKKTSSSSSKSSSSKKTSSSSSKSSSSGSSTGSSKSGSGIAAKAQQYAGKLKYVWGGSSLTSGADCSGFTMAIYKSFGISLPHSSSAQARGGRSISSSELKPGDLVFYGKKGISHVAIYIGGGKICHEANSRRGCQIDSIGYCGTPVKYVTYTH